MRYAFFLGCLIPARELSYESSIRKVAPKLDIELVEMKGANCCGPFSIQSVDYTSWLALAARNLCIAEEMKLDILTLCNGCYGTLKEANEILKTDSEQRDKVNTILSEIKKEYHGSIQVRHIAEMLYRDIGPDKLSSMTKKPLQLNVAVHYGCHLLKPTKYREIKSPERPRFLDEMVEALGAKSIPYRDRMLCCGAGGGVRTAALDVSLDMAREKLQNVKDAGADLIVTPCGFCVFQLDRGQIEIKDKSGIFFDIPVLHFVQFLGLALGLPPEKLGVYNNAVPTDSVIKKI